MTNMVHYLPLWLFSVKAIPAWITSTKRARQPTNCAFDVEAWKLKLCNHWDNYRYVHYLNPLCIQLLVLFTRPVATCLRGSIIHVNHIASRQVKRYRLVWLSRHHVRSFVVFSLFYKASRLFRTEHWYFSTFNVLWCSITGLFCFSALMKKGLLHVTETL